LLGRFHALLAALGRVARQTTGLVRCYRRFVDSPSLGWRRLRRGQPTFDGGVILLQNLVQGFRQVAEQVPAIGHLQRGGRTLENPPD
jgi:hypothetical protein